MVAGIQTVDKLSFEIIIRWQDKAHAMSGSNCICVMSVLLETGRLAMTEPETLVRVDTPAGLVTATAACRDGKCERVALDMMPSFVEALDVPVEVPGLGTVRADVAFGGVYFALVEAGPLGLEIVPAAARSLVDAGCRIHRALKNKLGLRPPAEPAVGGLAYVMFVERRANGQLVGANVMQPGRIDRSPCGTGNAARLAARHARGEAAPGERLTARSIIDSAFEVTFTSETEGAGRPAVLARVAGRGWIHGFHQIGRDPADPYPEGYLLSDCWGEVFDLIH